MFDGFTEGNGGVESTFLMDFSGIISFSPFLHFLKRKIRENFNYRSKVLSVERTERKSQVSI